MLTLPVEDGLGEYANKMCRKDNDGYNQLRRTGFMPNALPRKTMRVFW
jgi:hypothetical protein